MKFATKMALATVVLLTLFLAVGGMLTVQRSFADSLATAQTRCAQQQRKEKYAIEKVLYTAPQQEQDGQAPFTRFQYYAIAGAAQSLAGASGGGGTIAVYAQEQLTLFSNMPAAIPKNEQIKAVQAGPERYTLWRKDGATHLLMTLPLNIPSESIVLLSAYDVSDVFASRDAQLDSLLRLMLVLLLPAVLLSWLVSRLLTRPIDKLRRASETIAAGEYSGRTQLRTGDELEALSRSFDAMAASVQSNVTALQNSVREQEDFVTAFTHEIKTPMTSMLGYASVLRSREQPPEVQRDAANYIYHETKRLSELAHKLMQLMGLGKEALALVPIRLGIVLAGVRKSMPQENGVPVTFSPCAKDVTVLGDKALLDDLLRNLIINAQRACAQKGEVTVSCERQETTCALVVSDTGCGIPAEEIQKITEPFYMVDKSRARSENGSGMGLALCSRIAALHGGRLEIASEQGSGTQVRLVLPLAPQEVQA